MQNPTHPAAVSGPAIAEYWECGECGSYRQDSGDVPRPVLCPECHRPLDPADWAPERVGLPARNLASGRVGALLATIEDEPD